MADLLHFQPTQHGFEWGAAKIVRLFGDDKKGWVVIGLETPRHPGHKGLQIYVTKTGKVRISDSRGEWSAPRNEDGRGERP